MPPKSAAKALIKSLEAHDAMVQSVHRTLHGPCKRVRCIYNQMRKEAEEAIAQAS